MLNFINKINMYNEITQIKSVEEIEIILLKNAEEYFFNKNELKSVEHKNKIKSLGARYLIKKSILDYLNLHEDYKDIEIDSDEQGKPFVRFIGRVKKKIEEMGIGNVQVSISHSRNFISTLVVLDKNV